LKKLFFIIHYLIINQLFSSDTDTNKTKETIYDKDHFGDIIGYYPLFKELAKKEEWWMIMQQYDTFSKSIPQSNVATINTYNKELIEAFPREPKMTQLDTNQTGAKKENRINEAIHRQASTPNRTIIDRLHTFWDKINTANTIIENKSKKIITILDSSATMVVNCFPNNNFVINVIHYTMNSSANIIERHEFLNNLTKKQYRKATFLITQFEHTDLNNFLKMLCNNTNVTKSKLKYYIPLHNTTDRNTIDKEYQELDLNQFITLLKEFIARKEKDQESNLVIHEKEQAALYINKIKEYPPQDFIEMVISNNNDLNDDIISFCNANKDSLNDDHKAIVSIIELIKNNEEEYYTTLPDKKFIIQNLYNIHDKDEKNTDKSLQEIFNLFFEKKNCLDMNFIFKLIKNQLKTNNKFIKPLCTQLHDKYFTLIFKGQLYVDYCDLKKAVNENCYINHSLNYVLTSINTLWQKNREKMINQLTYIIHDNISLSSLIDLINNATNKQSDNIDTIYLAKDFLEYILFKLLPQKEITLDPESRQFLMNQYNKQITIPNFNTTLTDIDFKIIQYILNTNDDDLNIFVVPCTKTLLSLHQNTLPDFSDSSKEINIQEAINSPSFSLKQELEKILKNNNPIPRISFLTKCEQTIYKEIIQNENIQDNEKEITETIRFLLNKDSTDNFNNILEDKIKQLIQFNNNNNNMNKKEYKCFFYEYYDLLYNLYSSSKNKTLFDSMITLCLNYKTNNGSVNVWNKLHLNDVYNANDDINTMTILKFHDTDYYNLSPDIKNIILHNLKKSSATNDQQYHKNIIQYINYQASRLHNYLLFDFDEKDNEIINNYCNSIKYMVDHSSYKNEIKSIKDFTFDCYTILQNEDLSNLLIDFLEKIDTKTCGIILYNISIHYNHSLQEENTNFKKIVDAINKNNRLKEIFNTIHNPIIAEKIIYLLLSMIDNNRIEALIQSLEINGLGKNTIDRVAARISDSNDLSIDNIIKNNYFNMNDINLNELPNKLITIYLNCFYNDFITKSKDKYFKIGEVLFIYKGLNNESKKALRDKLKTLLKQKFNNQIEKYVDNNTIKKTWLEDYTLFVKYNFLLCENDIHDKNAVELITEANHNIFKEGEVHADQDTNQENVPYNNIVRLNTLYNKEDLTSIITILQILDPNSEPHKNKFFTDEKILDNFINYSDLMELKDSYDAIDDNPIFYRYCNLVIHCIDNIKDIKNDNQKIQLFAMYDKISNSTVHTIEKNQKIFIIKKYFMFLPHELKEKFLNENDNNIKNTIIEFLNNDMEGKHRQTDLEDYNYDTFLFNYENNPDDAYACKLFNTFMKDLSDKTVHDNIQKLKNNITKFANNKNHEIKIIAALINRKWNTLYHIRQSTGYFFNTTNNNQQANDKPNTIKKIIEWLFIKYEDTEQNWLENDKKYLIENYFELFSDDLQDTIINNNYTKEIKNFMYHYIPRYLDNSNNDSPMSTTMVNFILNNIQNIENTDAYNRIKKYIDGKYSHYITNDINLRNKQNIINHLNTIIQTAEYNKKSKMITESKYNEPKIESPKNNQTFKDHSEPSFEEKNAKKNDALFKNIKKNEQSENMNNIQEPEPSENNKGDMNKIIKNDKELFHKIKKPLLAIMAAGALYAGYTYFKPVKQNQSQNKKITF
jgi:hypothetical protein